ncbi:Granulin [Holothuria leucospilota]|uniref:Granulin n=1 Tax=Holothuria leucospilota TaxID=206669 RepID=A0A9Q1BFL9_HOLLE|nr:Granulin [Holothuria leucospilota]
MGRGHASDPKFRQHVEGMKLLLLLCVISPVALGVLCPDQQTRCDSKKTCCLLQSGGYGCCPLPNAVCCSDKEHCCPSGYTCDVEEGTCSKEFETIPWMTKELGEEVESVRCSDGKHYCPDKQTCCAAKNGTVGCCPFEKANCCSDLIHCCPNGYTCEGSSGRCYKDTETISWTDHAEANLESITCPDGSECPDGNTCCLLSSGQYGCCPLPNAVCCSDHLHCCPNGYTCDVSAGTCTKGNEVMTWFEKTEAKSMSVICPDGQSECPDGNTCCKLSSGQYGCCPIPNAVCCSDHLHCCPSGYTCDVSAGTCTKGNEVMTWFEKTEAKVKSVICPDGQSECPDGNTCCKLSSGQYGCCPIPNAVCCSDHLHCCPSGYTCDVSAGTCTKGNEVMTWFEKTEAKVNSVICPDGQSECPDGNTCCKLSSGQYGCCPIPNAVCCSDHLHCCPSGYTCDVSAGTCTKGNEVMTWFEKTEAKVKSVICPDGQSECPDGNTCCKLSSGQYGCCPIPNAVCCSDHLHCCPSGYTCDVSAGTCTKGSKVITWFEKTEAKVKSVICPDGQSECPDGNTCCKLSSGQYGCCPIPNAVCCSDHLHCCPSGYTCDVSAGTCTKGNEVMTWFEKTEAKVKSVICPDGQSECPDGNTCCKLSSGQYGCCPIPNAVCCSDHLHCCPSGYTCDVSAGTCTKGSKVMTWFEKTEAKVRSVICPDGQSECPDGNTCCKLSSGQYGCCPIPNAVCCSDHLHCCPSGYTCDVSAGTCTKGDEVMTWFEKTEAKVKSVICPDGQSECPDGNTCCKLSSGQYGCCPIPNAVCCSDHLHCCPSGYTCDVSAGTCTKGSKVMTWFEKTEAKVNSVICPDGQSECPDGNTCCLLSSGQYGCCPIPNAVCCSDHLHCCPSGYTCDVSAGTCTKGDEVMTWFEKTEAKVKSVICPDGQSECPDGNTCCKLSSGQYGCCPIPNAVCCSDDLHCCPSGYTCDVSAGTCTKGNEVMTWFEKTEAKVKSVICPDGQSECPDGNTCCLLSSGQYGCCPIPNAVCCSDHLHCCPSGYTCDVSAGTCTKGNEVMTWFEKTEAKVKSVICPDGQSECPDGNTCCLLSSGQYGCCPIPNAVCCSDHLHCCPSGYTCDVSAGTCTKGDEVMTWFEKTEAKVKSVICPDGQSECPDGNTCCLLSSGQYGCCPIPNAVCCSDHLHCCPSGYTCDVSAGTCSKGDEVMTWFEKTEAKVTSVICPDGQSECPDGNTCCKLSSGQYGCCPIPNAVCCSDHLHCCPSGYTCDVSAGTCTKGDEVMTWFEKTEAKVKSVICPDGQSECPDGNTCCKLSSGQYGCCPIPNAVCCSDHLHCCPSGYTCDVSAGTCTKGSKVITWFEKTEAKVKSVICPDGQSECPDGNTCCKLSSGQYGCCPIPNAVCCSDHLHCCPSGYTCDVSAGTCTKGSKVITWFEKTEAKVKSVICPDGQSECPDGNTCCKLSSGQYGCCPIPNAVCCSDHLHCCPSGYTCDVSAGTCTKGNEVMTWFEKTEAKVKSVICPDGQSECPDGNTCCKLSSGQYGCCPIPNAVCCSDHLHCCPSGYTCDVSAGTCTKGNEVMTWFEKTEAKVKSVICPDGQSECPDGNTCCLLSSGQYGCCPIPNAVCCSDHLHCCPSGYTCDVSAGTCTKGDEVMTWFEKTEAKAVCCSDHLHCCPSGYTCDVSAGTCTKGNEVMNWFEKTEAKVKSVICPDGQSECPDGNTCCKLSSGQYGCCPIPNAVCCSDHLHCCPSGYTCDVSAGTCTKGDEVMTWFEKTEAKAVCCSDHLHCCPSGYTCDVSAGTCTKGSKVMTWFEKTEAKAVCCSDHLHCCPSGYTCDVSAGTCTKGKEVMTWFEKTEAKVKSVICPDGQSECPDGNTCCKLSSGQYGCCPIPNAVCCSDHLHCCPSGYTCDVSAGTCTKGNEVMTWFEKTEAKVKSVVCPDGQSECPDGNTCCKLSSGQYGCCPIPNVCAVCCSDHLHCCPSGYTCDVSAGTCTKGNEVMTWFEKTEAKVTSVICPDGQSECPDGNTCCKLSSGQYGCCPIPNAVCCSDHLHCCPSGYTCDVSAGTCTKGNEVMTWFEKTRAISSHRNAKVPLQMITCPDNKTICPEFATCCPGDTEYSCCPAPHATCCPDKIHCCPEDFKCINNSTTCQAKNGKSVVAALKKIVGKAVCCRDKQHCCPSGYTCDLVHASCSKGGNSITWFKKVPSLSLPKRSKDMTCPDKYQTCPDNTTCCRINDDLYGCCPHPNAVCCDDGRHCCPAGFSCDAATGTCSDGSKNIPASKKYPSKK